jgi:hypothetical protein
MKARHAQLRSSPLTCRDDPGSAYALGVSSDFARLIADIEREAHEEGPQAVRELEQFREEFRLAVRASPPVEGEVLFPADPR